MTSRMSFINAIVALIASAALSVASLALDIHLLPAVISVVGLLLIAIIISRTKYVPKGDLL